MGDGPGSKAKPGMGRASHPGQHQEHIAGTRLRQFVAYLLVKGMQATARWAVWLVGRSHAAGGAQFSEAELRDLVAHSVVLDGEERRLIDDVIAAGHRHVRELMVPRTEVVFLDATESLPQAARLVGEARHSRFPVIDGSYDDVVGFVHLRDVLVRPEADPVRTVAELARPLRSLPASKRVLSALSEMRREGDHLALVVDEYGGTAGIVTLEDLIEELVGEIHDEYDATPEPRPPDGCTPSEVDGLLNLNDFAELAGFALPSGPYETVGGFLMATLGRLPTLGDEVVVAANGSNRADETDGPDGADGSWRLTVVGMDGRRVSRVALSAGWPVPPLGQPLALPPGPLSGPPPDGPSPDGPSPGEPRPTEQPPEVPAASEPATVR